MKKDRQSAGIMEISDYGKSGIIDASGNIIKEITDLCGFFSGTGHEPEWRILFRFGRQGKTSGGQKPVGKQTGIM